MKKYILMSIGVATLTALAACGTKDRNFAAARYAKLKGQTPTTGLAACVPGQAGSIGVGGVLLSTADGGKNLDSHVSTQTISGTNSAANKKSVLANGVQVALSAPLAATLTTLTAQSTAQTYISFGCDDSAMPTDTVKNWKAVTVEDGATTSVNTIFVCGKFIFTSASGSTTLIADQMVLTQDSSLTMKSKASAGGLSIIVNKLGLKGTNSIGVQIADGQSFDGTGLPLSVNVIKTLDSDSSSKISLTSTGGSCVSAADQAIKDGQDIVDKADDAATAATTDAQVAATKASQAAMDATARSAGADPSIVTHQ